MYVCAGVLVLKRPALFEMLIIPNDLYKISLPLPLTAPLLQFEGLSLKGSSMEISNCFAFVLNYICMENNFENVYFRLVSMG